MCEQSQTLWKFPFFYYFPSFLLRIPSNDFVGGLIIWSFMSSLLFSKQHRVATITLNRPEAYNSINAGLAHAWIEALDEAEADPEVRTIVITGAGKAFCAGQDLKEVTDAKLNPGFKVLMEEHYSPLITRITKIEKPIVAAVNGVAAGAGANLALACDIVIASETASFIQAFSAIGLIPDSGGTWNLPRVVGRAKAMAYAMLGDKISAKEAERVGMIYRVVPNEDFQQEIDHISKRLATMATKGLGLTKCAINQSYSHTFEQQIALETQLQLEAAATEDYKEGVHAFVEKRVPVFRGS